MSNIFYNKFLNLPVITEGIVNDLSLSLPSDQSLDNGTMDNGISNSVSIKKSSKNNNDSENSFSFISKNSNSFFEMKRNNLKKNQKSRFFFNDTKNSLNNEIIKTKKKKTYFEEQEKKKNLLKGGLVSEETTFPDNLGSNKIIGNEKNALIWKNTNVELNYTSKISELRKINLQILVWKNKKKNGEKRYFLLSECFGFFQKLFFCSNGDIKENLIIKNINFDSDLFFNGKYCGVLKSNLRITHKLFIEQKQKGLFTEKGLINSFTINFHSKSMGNKMVKSLNSWYKDLNEAFVIMNDAEYDTGSKRLQENIINSIIPKILDIFLKTERSNMLTFSYKTNKDLFKAQELFLQIGKLLIDSYTQMDDFSNDDYYKCIQALFLRDEFSLSNLGYNNYIHSKKDDENKKKIGIWYQEILYTTLENVFYDLNREGLCDYKRKFIEFFISFAYFRIPKFRIELLKYLNKGQYVENIDENEFVKSLLNWDKEFFNYLTENKKEFKYNTDMLERTLKMDWKQKFASKKTFFFYFLIEWCDYVKMKYNSNLIEWEKISGYEVLVKKYAKDLKKRKINNYPEILIISGLELLKNDQNLNLFLHSLICSTK